MNRFILMTIVAVLSFAGAAGAQAEKGKHSAEQKEKFFMAKMKIIQQELNLTEAQTNEFTPIYRSYDNEMQAIFEKHRVAEKKHPKTNINDATKVVNLRIEMKMDLLRLQRRYTGKFAKVLNAEQLLKLDAAEQKIQFQIMKRRGHRKGKNNATVDNAVAATGTRL